jgi:hypothetical protein
VVTKVRQRLSLSIRAEEEFHMERFNLENLHDGEVKEQYQVKISNTFPALENLHDDNADIMGKYYRQYESFSHRESRIVLDEIA